MNINQENKDALSAVVKIEFEKSDYQPLYEKALKDYRKRVNLPGFRQGHVPMGIVKKRFGTSLLADEINNLISSSLQKHIEDNKLRVLGNPMPSEDREDVANWENPDKFEFNFDLALAPDFEVKINDKTKFDFHRVKVSESMIDEQVDSLLRRHGKMSDVETAQDKDVIIGDFVELDENDQIKEAGILSSGHITLEFLKDEPTKKSLVGLKAGDHIVVDPYKVSDGEEDLAKMLNISPEEAAQVNTNYRFNVKEVKRMTPAEMNQELFDKLFGEGQISSEKELRDRIKQDMENMFAADSERLFQREMMKSIEKKLDVKLPDDLLKRWIKMSNEKPLSDSELEQQYPDYRRGLVWQLVQNALIKELDVKVSGDDVLDYTKSVVANNFKQYGMPAPPDEELTEYAKSALKNQEEVRKIYDQLYEKKMVQAVRDTAKINEVSLDYDKFVEFAQQA